MKARFHAQKRKNSHEKYIWGKEKMKNYFRLIGKKVSFNDPINGIEYGIVKSFDGRSLFTVETFDSIMMIFRRHELKVING